MQAEDAVPNREQRDDEHFTVGLADVLGEQRRGLGGNPDLRPLGGASRLAPGPGRYGSRGWCTGGLGWGSAWRHRRKDGRGRLSIRLRPVLQAAASTLRYSSRIHAFTVLTVSPLPSIARR